MLELKIRETELNVCDTLSANDPYRRWHCREQLDLKTVKIKMVLTQEKKTTMIS